MPVGMEVTEDTPPDMFTGSMNLKLVLPSGKKIKTSIDRSTPMMDLLVHVTTCHKLSPAAHVLQPYGERGILPYKPSTPIGALDTVMVHVVPKNQLTQNQSNKVALKQISQPFEQTYRIQVSLPRNQLYVLRANGRTTIADIHTEICNEKNLDPTKYSLRHPKELGVELKSDTTIAEYKSNQLVLVSNRSNPTNQLSTDDIINAIHNITKNSNNNIYAFEPSSRSLSPDSSVSPVAEPPKPLRKKKAPAPKPPVIQSNVSQKVAKEKTVENVSSSRIISHSRTSSDSSGYHEASLLSESPPSNNSSLPDSLPRRSKFSSKSKTASLDTSGGNVVAQNPALSKSLSDLKVPIAESPSVGAQSSQSQSSLKPAQSTTSLNTGRKKRLAPPPPPSAQPTMRTVIEERTQPSSDGYEIPLEVIKERSRTLESDRRAAIPSDASSEKSRTLPPGISMNTVDIDEIKKDDVVDNQRRDETITPVAVAPPDERDLVMEDEEIDRIFNNATADHSNSLTNSAQTSIAEANDSGRDSTDSNEVRRTYTKNFIPSPIIPQIDSLDSNLPEFSPDQNGSNGLALPSPVKSIQEQSGDTAMDWEYKLPAPPTFRDPPDSLNQKCPSSTASDYDRINSDNTLNLTPRSAVMSELSSVISQRSSSLNSCLPELPSPQVEQIIENTSTLDNFKITTYAPSTNTRAENKVTVRRNNSLVREQNNSVNYSQQNLNQNLNANSNGGATVKRSVSHVSLFLRPYETSRSKTLDRIDDDQKSPVVTLRKTSSEFNIDSVGRKSERPQSCIESQGLQSLQVLRSILPQLSQSQGSLNSISETEQPKPYISKIEQPVSQVKPQSQTRFERDEKVAVSLGTWGERPKRQVSIKSDRDYVFGKVGGFPKTSSEVQLDQMENNTSSLPSSNLLTSSTYLKGITTSNDLLSKRGSMFSSTDNLLKQENQPKSIPEEDSTKNLNESIILDTDDKPKRVLNVYKSLDTGNTKPLRQILGEISRVPVVRSVELKAPYKEWQNQSQNPNRGLDRLKERFETDNKQNNETLNKNDEVEKFESTNKIRERFETAIKERYETTGKLINTRRDIDNNNSVISNSNKESTKVNINQISDRDESNNNDCSISNKVSENLQKYESKVRINQSDDNNKRSQSINVQSKNKMISSTKIELNEMPTKSVNSNLPLTNRYTSVIGIGGNEEDVVRVRVKTSTGRAPVATSQRQSETPDPRQQLLTSIRGFGGLDSLKKVRS